MDEKLSVLHELLSKALYIVNRDESDALIEEFSNKLDVSDDNQMSLLLSDIKKLCDEISFLRSEKSNDFYNRQLSTLTEQERKELAESLRIISENLFDYHFQPIVSAIDGEIYSYEALMRPRSELCPSPFHIIKYAEFARKLEDIEARTFLNVLNIIDTKKELFSDKKIFINSIPRAEISEEEFEIIKKLLIKHTGSVIVEMTEQSELNDYEINEIKELYRQYNLKIALDDYGTGYANVQNLLRYMPDFVKIDRSLLSGIHNNKKKRHFVREIVEFCHENNILAIAEGVETTEELRSVIMLGVDLIQGYYTSRPTANIIDSIPYEIRKEIMLYQEERQTGKKQHIYTAENNERISIERLSKGNYDSIFIGSESGSDITVTSSPGINPLIHIEIENGFKGTIHLENVTLTSFNNHPCIIIGENCDVLLDFIGSNFLVSGGICVPETSKLTCSGDGHLKITVDGSSFYAIGNDMEKRHGELVFEAGITIDNKSAACVCIGSGLGGKINFIRGQYLFSMTGYMGVGIGAYTGDCDVNFFASDITINGSLERGVGVGTLSGNCKAQVNHAAIKTYISGNEIVGIGTLGGIISEVTVDEASVVTNVAADRCTGIGALYSNSKFSILKSNLNIASEGKDALAIGGIDGVSKIDMVNSDCTINLTTDPDYMKYVDESNIHIIGGRMKVTINEQTICE